MLYLASAFVSVYLQRLQVDVTGGSLAVMHDLRIKVFTHFQRLSLDFSPRRRRASDEPHDSDIETSSSSSKTASAPSPCRA